MNPLKKIIVCLDHSPVDQEIIANACEISKVAGTQEIIFLNIIKDFNLPETIKKEFPDLIKKALEEREAEIQLLANEFFRCDIPTRILVKQGSETKEVIKVAQEIDADLIILGKKKKSESVFSTRVARRSPCNLLFIPEGKKLKFDRIMIPVDFSDYSLLSLKQATDLTKEGKSKIFLQNVFQVPSSYRYSGKSFNQFAEIIKGHIEKDVQILLRQAEITDQDIETIYTLDRNGGVIDLMLKEGKKSDIDLIVMGAKGITTATALFIGSKSERMIRSNHDIPMMIIRKKGAVAGLLESLKEQL